MKKIICFILLILLLTGCSVPDNTENQTAEAVSTCETQEITSGYEPDILLITQYGGKDEYISTDGGITWTKNGEEIDIPPVFLTLLSPNPISFSAKRGYVGSLHNIEEEVLKDGFYYKLTRYENGEWVTAEYADKTKTTIGDGILYYLIEGQAFDFIFRLCEYEPIEGRYRLTVTFDVYTCIVEFNAVL